MYELVGEFKIIYVQYLGNLLKNVIGTPQPTCSNVPESNISYSTPKISGISKYFYLLLSSVIQVKIFILFILIIGM